MLATMVSMPVVAQDAEPACDAAEVWERMIEAKGGRERLHEIDVYFMAETEAGWSLFRRRRYEHYVLASLPDKQWGWHDYGSPFEARGVSVVDWVTGIVTGESAYDDFVVRTMPLEERAIWGRYRREALYLLETKWKKPVVSNCVALPEGGYTIDADFDEAQYRYHLPPREFLPNVVEWWEIDGPRRDSGKGLAVQYWFSDYTDVGGVMMPRQQVFRPSSREDVGVRHNLCFEWNPEYDTRIFEMPPSFDAGPDAWRPKRR